MASILKVDTLTGVTTAGSVAVTGEGNSTTTNLQQGLTKQWCNLDGTGTIGINDSFNVSSVTDNGTGNYGFTCTSNFASANHTPAGMCVAVGSFSAIDLPNAAATTGTPNFRTFNITETGIDSDPVTYQSCGDLA
tara:strand:- start:90 stop:494 length:405 start_codon:yes stop_codon:yes gene_type:complete